MASETVIAGRRSAPGREQSENNQKIKSSRELERPPRREEAATAGEEIGAGGRSGSAEKLTDRGYQRSSRMSPPNTMDACSLHDAPLRGD